MQHFLIQWSRRENEPPPPPANQLDLMSPGRQLCRIEPLMVSTPSRREEHLEEEGDGGAREPSQTPITNCLFL